MKTSYAMACSCLFDVATEGRYIGGGRDTSAPYDCPDSYVNHHNRPIQMILLVRSHFMPGHWLFGLFDHSCMGCCFDVLIIQEGLFCCKQQK